MIELSSTESVFQALSGPAEVGRAIGVTTEHAAGFKRRGRIPPRYWEKLIVALREKGHHRVTEADLTKIYNAGSQHAPAEAAS